MVLAAHDFEDLAVLGAIALLGEADLGQDQIAVSEIAGQSLRDQQAFLGFTIHRLHPGFPPRLADHAQDFVRARAQPLDQPSFHLAVFERFETNE